MGRRQQFFVSAVRFFFVLLLRGSTGAATSSSGSRDATFPNDDKEDKDDKENHVFFHTNTHHLRSSSPISLRSERRENESTPQAFSQNSDSEQTKSKLDEEEDKEQEELVLGAVADTDSRMLLPAAPKDSDEGPLGGAGEPRVVGGTPAEEGEFPWFVYAPEGDFIVGCSGTLIALDMVLTNAGCEPIFVPGSTLFVGATRTTGENINGLMVTVARTIVHPSYDDFEFYRDNVMLVQLTEPVPRNTPTVILNADPLLPPAGRLGTVMGHGHIANGGPLSPEQLMQVDMVVLSPAQCRDIWANTGVIYDETIHFCAGRDTMGAPCFGDGGSPLMDATKTNFQYGFYSFIQVPCPQPGSGFTRVDPYVPWIKEQLCIWSNEGENCGRL